MSAAVLQVRYEGPAIQQPNHANDICLTHCAQLLPVIRFKLHIIQVASSISTNALGELGFAVSVAPYIAPIAAATTAGISAAAVAGILAGVVAAVAAVGVGAAVVVVKLRKRALNRTYEVDLNPMYLLATDASLSGSAHVRPAPMPVNPTPVGTNEGRGIRKTFYRWFPNGQ